jgi:ABC-2 type transport system permease protein
MSDSVRAPAQQTPAAHAAGPTLTRVTRSESVKLRTLRSNVVLITAAALFLLVLGPVQALGQVVAPQGEPIADLGAATSLALNGGLTAALLLGVLGVLSVTSEFPTALVRTTFWAVPRRGLVVRGKALAFVGLLAPLVLIGAAVAIEASRIVLTRVDSPLTWAEPDVWWTVGAMSLYAVGWGLLGQALGWILRSAVGAAFALLGLMFVLPMLAALLPAPVAELVLRVLPSEVGSAMLRVDAAGPGLAPQAAALVWVGWTLVGLSLATVVIRRRDA